MGTSLFPGVKGPGRGVNHTLHLTLRLNKEYSYTCIPLRAFVVCYRINIAFMIICLFCIRQLHFLV